MDSNQFVITSIEPQFISEAFKILYTQTSLFFQRPTHCAANTDFQANAIAILRSIDIYSLAANLGQRRTIRIAWHRSRFGENRRTTWVKEVMKLRCQSMRAPRTSEITAVLLSSLFLLFSSTVGIWTSPVDLTFQSWFDTHTRTHAEGKKFETGHPPHLVWCYCLAKGEERGTTKVTWLYRVKEVFALRSKALGRPDEKKWIKRTMTIF